MDIQWVFNGILATSSSRDVAFDAVECVGALGHPAGASREVRADRRVGTGVAEQSDPQVREGSVVSAAQFDVLHLAAAVGEGHLSE